MRDFTVNDIKDTFIRWVILHPDVWDKDETKTPHFWWVQNFIGNLIGWNVHPSDWLKDVDLGFECSVRDEYLSKPGEDATIADRTRLTQQQIDFLERGLKLIENQQCPSCKRKFIVVDKYTYKCKCMPGVRISHG